MNMTSQERWNYMLGIGWNIPMKILLLEQQVMIAEFMKLLLEREGHDTSIYNNCDELISNISSINLTTYDVFVLDVSVPKCAGFTIGQEIRQRIPEAKIMFYSALEDEESVNRRFHLDSQTKYLRKPFGREELLKKIQEFNSVSSEKE
jgi:DNA-binding response OmpR family regulator